ncbi:hypothetical protein SORBI_3010G170800 [Sorghum bicolor]|uniref:Uncharacterized protein n=1 Tax=Sorghum bicolor TaxID=4558 RepID=A0A194YJT6_SORBI|nr:hypothetical protein SORBI_3010G170800 [Sorghum bicolor]
MYNGFLNPVPSTQVLRKNTPYEPRDGTGVVSRGDGHVPCSEVEKTLQQRCTAPSSTRCCVDPGPSHAREGAMAVVELHCSSARCDS